MRRDLDGRSPYGDLIGRTIVSVDPEARAVEVAYEAREVFVNRRGTVAGGMLSGMLDSVTGLAALAALPDDLGAAHTTLRVEYLRPARPGRLIGRARVTELGDRDIQARGELIDDDGVTLARAEATLRILRKE